MLSASVASTRSVKRTPRVSKAHWTQPHRALAKSSPIKPSRSITKYNYTKIYNNLSASTAKRVQEVFGSEDPALKQASIGSLDPYSELPSSLNVLKLNTADTEAPTLVSEDLSAHVASPTHQQASFMSILDELKKDATTPMDRMVDNRFAAAAETDLREKRAQETQQVVDDLKTQRYVQAQANESFKIRTLMHHKDYDGAIAAIDRLEGTMLAADTEFPALKYLCYKLTDRHTEATAVVNALIEKEQENDDFRLSSLWLTVLQQQNDLENTKNLLVHFTPLGDLHPTLKEFVKPHLTSAIDEIVDPPMEVSDSDVKMHSGWLRVTPENKIGDQLVEESKAPGNHSIFLASYDLGHERPHLTPTQALAIVNNLAARGNLVGIVEMIPRFELAIVRSPEVANRVWELFHEEDVAMKNYDYRSFYCQYFPDWSVVDDDLLSALADKWWKEENYGAFFLILRKMNKSQAQQFIGGIHNQYYARRPQMLEVFSNQLLMAIHDCAELHGIDLDLRTALSAINTNVAPTLDDIRMMDATFFLPDIMNWTPERCELYSKYTTWILDNLGWRRMHIENVIGLAFCHVKLDRIDLWVTTSGPLYDMILFQGIIPYEVSDAFQYISDWRIRKLLSVADYKQIQSMMPMMDEVGLVFEDPGVPYAMGGTDFHNYLDLNKNETILGFIDSFPDMSKPVAIQFATDHIFQSTSMLRKKVLKPLWEMFKKVDARPTPVYMEILKHLYQDDAKEIARILQQGAKHDVKLNLDLSMNLFLQFYYEKHHAAAYQMTKLTGWGNLEKTADLVTEDGRTQFVFEAYGERNDGEGLSVWLTAVRAGLPSIVVDDVHFTAYVNYATQLDSALVFLSRCHPRLKKNLTNKGLAALIDKAAQLGQDEIIFAALDVAPNQEDTELAKRAAEALKAMGGPKYAHQSSFLTGVTDIAQLRQVRQ